MKRQTDPYARLRRVQQEAVDALAEEIRLNTGAGSLSGLLCPADGRRFDEVLRYWARKVRAAVPADGRGQYEVTREVSDWFERMVLSKPSSIGGLPSHLFTEEEHARLLSLIEGELGGEPVLVERDEKERRRNTEEMAARAYKHADIMDLWDEVPEAVQKEARLLVNAPEPQSEAEPMEAMLAAGHTKLETTSEYFVIDADRERGHVNRIMEALVNSAAPEPNQHVTIVLPQDRRSRQAAQHGDLPDMRQRIGNRALEQLLGRQAQWRVRA